MNGSRPIPASLSPAYEETLRPAHLVFLTDWSSPAPPVFGWHELDEVLIILTCVQFVSQVAGVQGRPYSPRHSVPHYLKLRVKQYFY
jgi:hypothetical protein